MTGERRNFAGYGTKRCHLDVTFLGDFFEARVAVFQLIFFRSQLIKLGNLEEHASVGAGNSGQAEESDCGAHHENVEVMHGDGNFAQLAVVPASHKQDVKAFSQILIL